MLLALAGGAAPDVRAHTQISQTQLLETDQVETLQDDAALDDSRQPALGAPLRLAPPTTLAPAQPGAATTLIPTNRPLSTNKSGNAGLGGLDKNAAGPSGIEINALGEVDPEAIGILDARNGGFGADMWSRSDRAAVEQLLRGLPTRLNSPTLRNLARRLLLTNAAPPQGRARSQESEHSLLSTRVDRLAALGDIGGLNELLRRVPQRFEDDRIARARTEGLLLGGQSEAACQEIRRAMARDGVTGYWRRAMIYCQLQAGQVDQAMLGVGLMAEQGTIADDPAFFSLVDAFTGADVVESLTVDSPLHLAMLAMIEEPVTDALIAEASPGLLIAIAESEQTELEPRTQAAERAVSTGVLPPESLIEIYNLYVFDSSELDNPESALEDLSGPPGRALLYQAIRDKDEWSDRAELLQRALGVEDEALYRILVRVLLPDLLEVPVVPQLVAFADPVGRALYAAGHYGDAAAWFTLARQEALLNPKAASAVTSLWPYARISGSPTLLYQGDMEAWKASREDDSPEEQARQSWLRGAFKALGTDTTISWLDLATGESSAPRPDGALLFALRDSSDMGRIGETVLISILIIGEEGPAEAHPTAFIAAVSALREVGLVQEARALAIEAALSKGI